MEVLPFERLQDLGHHRVLKYLKKDWRRGNCAERGLSYRGRPEYGHLCVTDAASDQCNRIIRTEKEEECQSPCS